MKQNLRMLFFIVYLLEFNLEPKLGDDEGTARFGTVKVSSELWSVLEVKLFNCWIFELLATGGGAGACFLFLSFGLVDKEFLKKQS